MGFLDDLFRGAQDTASRAFDQLNPNDGGKNWNQRTATPAPKQAPKRKLNYSPEVQQRLEQSAQRGRQMQADIYNPMHLLDAAGTVGKGIVDMGTGTITGIGNRVADFGQAGAEVIREFSGQNQADAATKQKQAAEYDRMSQSFLARAQKEQDPARRAAFINQARSLNTAKYDTLDQNAQDMQRGLNATDPRKTLTNAAETALDVATAGKGKLLLDGIKSTAAPVTKEALKLLAKNAAITSAQGAGLGAGYSGINTARDENATIQDYAKNMATGAAVGAGAGLVAQAGLPALAKGAEKTVQGTAKVAGAAKKQLDIAARKQDENFMRLAAQDKVLTRVEPHYIQDPVKRLDSGTVSQKKAQILNGNIEPIIAMKNADNTLRIVDGAHNFAAYKELGVTQIPTKIITPSELKTMKQGGYAQVPGIKGTIAEPERQLSRFPNKLLEEDRTAPIHTTLLQNSTHEVKKNADVLAATGQNIARDEAEALRFAKNGSSTEANATSLQLIDKYLNEGRMDEASELIKTVAPRFTRQGQETQILAAYSKLSPVGALKLANHVVDRSAKNAPKLQRLEDDTHVATQSIADVNHEAAKQITNELKAGRLGNFGEKAAPKAELTPEQRLANRINAPVDTKLQAADPIKDMVNTLHAVAKEALPNKGKTLPRNPMELVGQAIKNKAEYADIWQKAKELVAEKYKGNEAALAELDNYFAKQLDKPFSDKQLNKGVQNGLKGVDLAKIVRQHYTKADELGRDLKAKLIQEAGLNEAEAGQLASSIQKRFNELTRTKKEAVIKQMFGEKITPAQKTAADRILEMSNLGALGRDDLRPLVAQKLKMESLSKEAATEINRRAQALQAMPEGSPERLRATAEMMQYIAKQAPSGTIDKILGSWTAGLISGAKTITGAPASNATNAALGAVTNPLAAGLDATRTAITGAPRSNTIVSPMNYLKGFAKGLPEAGRYLKTGIDERAPVTDMQRELNFKHKLPNLAVNGTFRLMGALDRPFYAGQKAMNEAEFAKLNRLNKDKPNQLTPDEQALAIETDSRKSVLDYDTLLSKVASAMKQAADKSDTAFGRSMGKVATTINSPFVRIPSAGLARMIDYSPVGAPIHAIRQAAEMKYGSQKSFSWRDMNKAIGESSVGAGVVVLGYALASSDRVSGEYPTSDAKEQARWQAEGITPNSIKIKDEITGKDTWVSLNYLGPVGSLIQQGKRFHDSRESGKGIAESTIAAEVGVGRDALNQSYLQGINNAMEATRDPERNLPSYVNGLASSTIPSAVNDVANLFDPYQRQVSNPADALLGRVPGARNTLPIKQDVYGKDQKQRTDPFNLTVNPLKPSEQRTSPVLDEVKRLHLADKNDTELQVTPTKLGKAISLGEENADGKNIQTKLTDKQRYDIQKTVGQATDKEWGKLIQTDAYKALDDKGKARALKDLRETVAEAEQHRYAMANNLGQYKSDFAGKKDKISKDAQKYMTAENYDITKFTKNKSDKSSGSTAEVSPNLAKNYKQTLDEFDALDSTDREKKIYKENDAEFRYEAAKYENKKASGTLTKAEAIKAEDKLAKLQVGSKFSKETRELYELNKSQLTTLIDKGEITEKQAADILAYGDALGTIGKTNKFKDKYGNVAIRPKAKGSGGRKGTGKGKGKGGAGSKKQLPSDDKTSTINLVASLSKKAASAKVTKRQIPSGQVGGIGKNIKAYKKVAKTNVSMTRKA